MRTPHVSAAAGAVLATLLLSVTAWAAAPPVRGVPAPLPDHPGNVFLAGEKVNVPVSVPDGAAWQAVDYGGKTVAEGKVAGNRVEVGLLPVGWYEVRTKDAAGVEGSVSLAVLAPLKAATPATSPIGIDVAMAWFYQEPRMAAVARLCELAGINWVRDRLNWGEVEPKRGEFAPAAGTRYDASARIQSAAGLRVLQVNHSSPAWASPNYKRFPPDLRDAYNFYRAMARRWAGQVTAYEPWNEADIDGFGGHTGAEMASLQKASALGLKAGDAGTTACMNVFASSAAAILRDLAENEAWPYFDTFNLHHYAPVREYPRIYAAFREVSAGRPLWVTEFAVPVRWSGDEKLKEPSPADLRVQAERIAQVFAASLHEGPQAAFYFMLPHYVEGQTQFGLLRASPRPGSPPPTGPTPTGPTPPTDLTPRPSYVALAAVGRLLADARPLGRLKAADTPVRAYLFRARPDGQDREVLVAWSEKGEADLPLPLAPEAAFNLLGQPAAPAQTLKLTAGPQFAVFASGAAAKFTLDPPPAAPPRLDGKPSPVVLQAVWPKPRVLLSRSAYQIAGDKPETVPVFAYNFSDRPLEGDFTVAAPAAWKVSLPKHVRLAPMERAELALVVDAGGAGVSPVETVRMTGDFGDAGRAVLSLRLLPSPNLAGAGATTPLPDALRAARWKPSITGGGKLAIAPEVENIRWLMRK